MPLLIGPTALRRHRYIHVTLYITSGNHSNVESSSLRWNLDASVFLSFLSFHFHSFCYKICCVKFGRFLPPDGVTGVLRQNRDQKRIPREVTNIQHLRDIRCIMVGSRDPHRVFQTQSFNNSFCCFMLRATHMKPWKVAQCQTSVYLLARVCVRPKTQKLC